MRREGGVKVPCRLRYSGKLEQMKKEELRAFVEMVGGMVEKGLAQGERESGMSRVSAGARRVRIVVG